MVKLRVTPRRPFFIESPKEVSSSGRDPVPACFRIFDDLGLDALVLHPPRPFESGHRRPEWQTRLQTRRVNGRLTQLLAGYDPSARYLVQALDLAEGPDAAATDQVMPSPEGRFTLTVFPQRRYRIRVWALPVGALEGACSAGAAIALILSNRNSPVRHYNQAR